MVSSSVKLQTLWALLIRCVFNFLVHSLFKCIGDYVAQPRKVGHKCPSVGETFICVTFLSPHDGVCYLASLILNLTVTFLMQKCHLETQGEVLNLVVSQLLSLDVKDAELLFPSDFLRRSLLWAVGLPKIWCCLWDSFWSQACSPDWCLCLQPNSKSPDEQSESPILQNLNSWNHGQLPKSSRKRGWGRKGYWCFWHGLLDC